eukprot:c21445_g1_i1 orf=38-907(+)
MSTALPVSPTDSAAPPPSPSVPSASPLPPKDVAREVQQEIRNLQSEDESTIMKAAASLVMLATLPEAEPHLGSCIPHLVSFLISDYSIHVQRNACAALTAIMNASHTLYHAVAEASDLMKGLLECLKPSVEDVGLRINAWAAIGVLAQQDLGLALVKEAGVEGILLSLLGHTFDAKLEEEMVDTFCALAAHEQMRPTLVHKGAVSKLALHLGSESSEICVRVLLALGMLCGSSVEGQFELAKADGAVKALVELMTSNDDDIKSIARDLVGALTSNRDTRVVVEQMMRNR